MKIANSMRCLVLFFGLWLLLLSPCAAGQDLITERAWLEDSTGKLQWSEVQRLKATPYEGVLSKGFGSSVIWVRLRIAGTPLNPGLVHNDLVLRVRPVYLD